MKKKILTLTIMTACVAMVAVLSCPESAWAVAGRCDNCHTMHYSENGLGGSLVTGWGDTGPYNKLLTNDCLGCHTATSADPFDDVTPFVAGTSLTDNACLAGGFFPATMGTGNNDDNHHGISASQTNSPAGYVDNGFTYTGGDDGLGCAGSNGCHGNETDTDDLQALSGGHHNVSATYRMLYDEDSNPVIGSGAKDYEEAIILAPSTSIVTDGASQNVNIYSAGASDVTISELCAKCHGNFHGTANVGSSGAWTRHPTDVAIPTEWAIGTNTYTLDGDDFKHNPVGYDGATYNATGGRKATCLSCHRAHGTANADLLRWDYDTQLAGSVTVTHGCLGCHDGQRG